MRAKSAKTLIADPYRAGLSLGCSLGKIRPEIVFLFITNHVENIDCFLDGLYIGLDDPSVSVIGTTGDGVLERDGTNQAGASGLAIATDGKVTWHLAYSREAETAPEDAVRNSLYLLELALNGTKPAFYYLLADSQADGSRIESAIQAHVDVPVIGGMTGDGSSRKAGGYQFIGREVLRDSIVILAAEGEIAFDIYACNSFHPIGSPGTIDAVSRNIVQRIGGLDAATFVEQQIGKPVLPSDQGLALAATELKFPSEIRLRAFKQDYSSDGWLMLRGSIALGEMVHVCTTTPEDLRTDMRSIAASISESVIEPVAALVTSCAGRKWLSGGSGNIDMDEIMNELPASIALAGFSAFGEFSPLRTSSGFTRNLFHNMTFVVLLLGR